MHAIDRQVVVLGAIPGHLLAIGGVTHGGEAGTPSRVPIQVHITDAIDGEAGLAERIDVPTKVRITGKAVVADDRDPRLSGTLPHHDLVRGSVGLGARRRACSS
jgi:hypothetical protein